MNTFLDKTIVWGQKGQQLVSSTHLITLDGVFCVSCCCQMVFPAKVKFYGIFKKSHHTGTSGFVLAVCLTLLCCDPHEQLMITAQDCLQHIPSSCSLEEDQPFHRKDTSEGPPPATRPAFLCASHQELGVWIIASFHLKDGRVLKTTQCYGLGIGCGTCSHANHWAHLTFWIRRPRVGPKNMHF